MMTTKAEDSEQDAEARIDANLLEGCGVHQGAANNKVRLQARDANVGGDSNILITVLVLEIDALADALDDIL